MKNIILVFLYLLFNFQLLAQCNTEYDHPKGRDSAMVLTTYQDFLIKGEYKKALPQWSELYQYCNAAAKGKVMSDGEKIYKGLMKTTDDSELKKKYALTLIEIMKSRVECYGDKPRRNGLPYYGYCYYQIGKAYLLHLKDYENAAAYFDKAIEQDSVFIEPNLLYYYAYTVVKLYREEKLSWDEYKNKHDELIKIVESDTARFSEAYERMLDEFRNFESSFDRFDCDYFVERLRGMFEDSICNEEFIENEILYALKKANCPKKHPFLEEVERSLGYVYDCTDDWKIKARYIDRGHNAFRYGCPQNAKKYYTLALQNRYVDSIRLSFAAMRLGRLHHKDQEWQQALDNYLLAASLNPNSGEPYILVGMLYLSANKNCDGVERQKVVYATLDYFRKAREFKDSRAEASEKIRTYKQYLPEKPPVMKPTYEEQEVGCVLKTKTMIQIN